MDNVFRVYQEHINPSWATLLRFMGLDVVEERSEGCYVYDREGHGYLDCLGGPGVFTMGHRHPKIVAAVHRQLDLMPLSSKLMLSPLYAATAERLAELAPGALPYVFLCNSGAEAIEGALKLARAATGRIEIVAADGGFHGKTFGALSASGREVYRQPFYPLVPGFSHVPFGDAQALDAAVTEQTAAVVLEPIQGEGGIVIPPDDYLPAARRICSDRGALLMLDEVQTGLARTGTWFACQWADVEPDVLVLGKALGGGVMPMGAFLARAELWGMFEENPLIHSSTFGGNPLACAAALAALEVIEEEGLCEKAQQRGEQLLAGLGSVAAEHPDLIRAVRGQGLLVGLEFADADIGGLVIAGLAQRRVLAAYGLNNRQVVRFEPPAVITAEQIDTVVEAVRDATRQAADILAASGSETTS
jgi:putrescine aminotransferase